MLNLAKNPAKLLNKKMTIKNKLNKCLRPVAWQSFLKATTNPTYREPSNACSRYCLVSSVVVKTLDNKSHMQAEG